MQIRAPTAAAPGAAQPRNVDRSIEASSIFGHLNSLHVPGPKQVDLRRRTAMCRLTNTVDGQLASLKHAFVLTIGSSS